MSEAFQISPEDAEEYTRALGQIMSGGWRQIALAQRIGVPEAIGMTTEAWVRERIGGYVRIGLDERREAVKELTDPEGEFHLSQRQAAEVLGIAQKTVSRDLQNESYDSSDRGSLEGDDDGSESYDSPEEFADASYEVGLADIDADPTVGDVRDAIRAAFDDEAVGAEMDAARHVADMARVRATWARFMGDNPPGVFAEGLNRGEIDRLLRDLDTFIGWLEQARACSVAARRPWKVV